jgi:hypothetical protein
MPALTNPKHEAFCQLTFEGARYGWSQGLCYVKAGFKATGHAAETSASRLMKNVNIRQRLAELGGSGAKKARVTAASLIEKLDVVFDGSVAHKQYSAAGRAVETQGKLAGVMTDRIEIGAPGAFAAPSSVEQVVDNMIADLGDPATALVEAEQIYLEIRAGLEARAAALATVVVDAPSSFRPTGEATLALELLRPTHRSERR